MNVDGSTLFPRGTVMFIRRLIILQIQPEYRDSFTYWYLCLTDWRYQGKCFLLSFFAAWLPERRIIISNLRQPDFHVWFLWNTCRIRKDSVKLWQILFFLQPAKRYESWWILLLNRHKIQERGRINEHGVGSTGKCFVLE